MSRRSVRHPDRARRTPLTRALAAALALLFAALASGAHTTPQTHGLVHAPDRAPTHALLAPPAPGAAGLHDRRDHKPDPDDHSAPPPRATRLAAAAAAPGADHAPGARRAGPRRATHAPRAPPA